MTGQDSLFSCIQPTGPLGAGDAALSRPAPPPPPRPRPAEAPASPAAPEAWVKKQEENSAAAVRRLAELENLVTGLKKELEESRSKAVADRESYCSSAKLFRAEVSSLALRLSAAEKSLAAGPAPAAISLSAITGLEQRLREMEARFSEALDLRLSRFDVSFEETARRSTLAQETAGGNNRRLDRMEERLARLTYIESRLTNSEQKYERICECAALTDSLKISVEELQLSLGSILQKEAALKAESNKNGSELQSLSRQVGQLSALFNHFRSELAFLMPGRREAAGG
jgi:chromosome segregation ATPase